MTTSSPTPAKADETTDLREVLDSVDGWQLVPVTPTTEMRRAMARACTLGWDIGDYTYERGLAVAPASPLPALLSDLIAEKRAAEAALAQREGAHAAEIQALEAERDEHGEYIIDLEHKVFHAEARAERLAEALTPFAVAAGAFPVSPAARREDRRRHELVWSYGTEDAGNRREISVADLRAARAALPEAVTPKETSDVQN